MYKRAERESRNTGRRERKRHNMEEKCRAISGN
jgi:hypothetical protein